MTARPPSRPLSSRLGDESGQAVILVALALVMLIGFVGFTVDVGNTMTVRRALQASSDAAATAAAQELSNTSGNPSASAIAKATEFSSVTGNKNARANIPAVSISTSVKCTNFMAQLMTNANCTSATTPANTVVVTQTSVVPMFFAKVLGFPSLTVRTTATAAMKGGGMPPLDVMIVLDTTGSMGSNCSATISGVSSPDRLDCAKAGIRTLLQTFWPCGQEMASCGTVTSGNVANPIDRVGLMVFPGLKSTTPVGEYLDCTSNVTSAEIAPYNASPVYQIVGLSSDYKTSYSSALQGSTSNMVKSVGFGDGAGCSGNGAYGVENPAGQGSYFTGVINAAQAHLAANARTDVQRVIIFVSDGDANEYAANTPANPCQEAVSAADTAAAADTWVYAVAYGASTSTSNSCQNDASGAGKLSAYTTMQGIASDSGKFFSQPTAGDLTTTFRAIGQQLLNTRLLDDSTN